MVQSLRILIVDDQPRARQSLHAVIVSGMHPDIVGEAANGIEALDQVEQFNPNVVLIDARMPELDGIETTRRIKAKSPATRVIVISLYGEYRDAALAAGADAFIHKGDAPEKLLTTLKTWTDSNIPHELKTEG